jgi:hypothetical protein
VNFIQKGDLKFYDLDHIVVELASKEKKNDFIENSWVGKKMQVHVGVYASVERGRTIHRGDTIRLKGK